MSRIDQALNLWEGIKRTDALPSAPATPSPLTDYPQEATSQPVDSVSPSSFEPAWSAQPAAEPLAPAKRVTRRIDEALEARLVTGASSSVSVEQYRRLAAILHEEQVRGNLKSVMVTSTLPSEGKTLTVVNLALTLSGSYGRRVLVIDADLRAPSMHRLLGVRNARGLSEALRDGGRELPIVEVASGLSVLTAGRPGPSPLAELTSERMASVIREASATFDWVLIDTPPVGLLPDAQVLARLAGAVVFVIAAGSTPSGAVQRALTELGTESIIGTVLNRVDDRRIPEANYYDDYYGRYDNQ